MSIAIVIVVLVGVCLLFVLLARYWFGYGNNPV